MILKQSCPVALALVLILSATALSQSHLGLAEGDIGLSRALVGHVGQLGTRRRGEGREEVSDDQDLHEDLPLHGRVAQLEESNTTR